MHVKRIATRIKLVAKGMTWNRDHLFEIGWRLAIILLPWQTRWFSSGISLDGLPWEASRFSIYLSWIPILSTIFLSVPSSLYEVRRRHEDPCSQSSRCFILTTLTLILLFILFSTYRPATVQWWIEVLLLMVFARTIMKHVDRDTLARWIVYAIIPHALLGIYQHVTQMVIGSKWLGIATQNPLTRGVSVIETMGERFLRAYGGLPHPNILGGWLVVGMYAALQSDVSRFKSHVTLCLFSVALILTFSRSAFLALFMLLLVVVFHAFRDARSRYVRLFSCTLILITCALTAATHWPLIVTRATSETRLEQRSISERREGLEHGWRLFKEHPWIGVGPRATTPPLPHNIPLLLLTELGLLGTLISLSVILAKARIHPLFPIPDTRYPILPLLSLLPILLLDHYLWSTWSGLALCALIFALIFTKQSALDTEANRLAIYAHRD